ncbi:MAG: cyclic peptide export ABC transporter [Acidobacteriota bacterium]
MRALGPISRLYQFVVKESPESWKLVLYMALLSGIANGVLLGVINAGALAASSDSTSLRLLLLFAIAMTVFVMAKKMALVRSTITVERLVKRLRIRVSDKIRKCKYVLLESLGRGDLYTKISQDTNFISQASHVIINAAQEAVVVVFCLVYIATLSFAACFVTVISILLAVYIYYYHQRALLADLKEWTRREAVMLDSLGHLVDGFKEVKVNRKRSDSLFDSIKFIAADAETLRSKTGIRFVTDVMFAQVFFYLLIATIIFLLPRLVPTYADVVIRTTAAILFIIGPLEAVVSAAPILSRANVALDNLYKLEDLLDTAQEDGEPVMAEGFSGFREIHVRSLVFSYLDPAGVPTFTIGPITFSLPRGQMLFIVGGNGTGKSTFLKLLTGLYYPRQGLIRVDDQEIHPGNLAAYRDLFSPIYSDFHLFDRLYGLEDIEESKVTALLSEMELEGKTEYLHGKFSTQNLSSGQRRRLALIVSLLEDKDVYVFDEWAADQDQRFRRHFYEVILRDLKSRGKTVVVITHDDRYWSTADRLIKMDYGEMVEQDGLG